ncbi:mediator of RNA polymerase II transcription subunit 16 [Patella vulgata]|uniref:mediator of RNA polymerase II transcription subunit 16 n=1 Tax=Patella vulgata TaxID=6465 RepID=UPI0021808C05|nr:mediator of RNA polymerase II transcription subunit 16 [Patella vulgata]
MELVYNVDFRSIPRSRDWNIEEQSHSCLSCRNIFAFSRPTVQNINNRDCYLYEIQYKVCVLDLDKPWDVYTVTTGNIPISYILWDTSGSKLLVINTQGMFQVWTMPDHVLSQWKLFGSTCLKGEEIIKVAWLHNGIQVMFNPDKKDAVMYNEKFLRNRITPSVSNFGRKPMDGWIAVSSSGLVSVGLLQDQDPHIITSKTSLASGHIRLTQVDIAFNTTGEVVLVVTDGSISTTVLCFYINITIQHITCTVTSKPGPGLFMKSQMEYSNKDTQLVQITHLNFMNRDSADTLLVCAGSHGYSCVEVWQLVEQMMPLSRIFQNAKPDYSYKTPKWMHKATFTSNSMLTSIATPILYMGKNYIDAPGFMSYFACTYKDGNIKIIHRHTIQPIHSCTLESLGVSGPQKLDKKIRSISHVNSLIQTGSGCGLIGVNGNKMVLIRVFNMREGPIQLSAPIVILLLEYMMCIGNDWWDIFLAVKQGMVEGICQRLSDNFQKQHGSMQEFLRMRLISLQMALYNFVNNGQQKAADCRALLICNSISSVLKGILRPKTVSAQDKSPAEKLTMVCTGQKEADIDSVIRNLDTEEFIVEALKAGGNSEMSLQFLQPLIQWVANFCLHLLSSIPLYQSYCSFPGSSLLRDVVVLNNLRELLVIIRIWGLINPGCLPVFTTTSQIDCLSILFKLLTKTWLCSKEGNIEYDETLNDECLLLPNQVLIPDIKQSFGGENYSYSVFSQQLPLFLSTGEEPDFLFTLQQTRALYIPESTVESRQKYDIVRQIHLGIKPSGPVRECCRCGSSSLLNAPANSSILKSWEQRFVKTCICGGHWKVVK